MKKYRIKVVSNGYIPQVRGWFFGLGWCDCENSGVHTKRELAEMWIDRELELEAFKVRYIEYP